MLGVVRMARNFVFYPCLLLGVRNPNLQFVITHVWKVFSQQYMECTERNLITRIWTFYQS